MLAAIGRAVLLIATVLAVPTGAFSQSEQKPQYGGTLEVATMFASMTALSWDPYDWNWKVNHDAGGVYEQLVAADLEKSVRRGGSQKLATLAWLAPDAQRGELAEKWELIESPLSLVFTLRKGIMFPEKPGVMQSRELTAEDVVFSFNRLRSSPKRIPTFHDFVERAEARDRYTVVYYLTEYNAEWDYRLAYGLYSAVVPREVVDAGAGNWRNVNGTGPFILSDFVSGSSNTYTKNPLYWDKETIGGIQYKIPFVDKVVYRTLRDEATQHAALRTGKVDMLETISWRAVAELKKNVPHLQWSRRLLPQGPVLALRTDQKPFDDVRVRRAMNMAINKSEIIKAVYGGDAELFGFPMYPDWGGYFEPLDSMPASVKELFAYDPGKAKALLKEAGYSNGFTFKLQYCVCEPDFADLAPMLVAYLAQIGVKAELQPTEYAAFFSALRTRTQPPGYLTSAGHMNPTTSLRGNFVTNQYINASVYSDATFDARMIEVHLTRDEEKRKVMLRGLTREIVEKAPYVWLPVPYVYAAWWPWVKNYGGEMSAGSIRPWPIYARIWIDQDLKKRLGY